LLGRGAACWRRLPQRAGRFPLRRRRTISPNPEADKIRDADTAALRIKLYISFAEDRLKKFEYEIHRSVPRTPPRRNPERAAQRIFRLRRRCRRPNRRGTREANGHSRSPEDDAREKQGILETLQKYQKDGPELDTYRDTLDDAIEGTKDALSDIDDAEKQATPGPVRRKPS